MCACVCRLVCARVCVCMRVLMHVSECMYAWLCVWVWVSVYVRVCICLNTCVSVCVYVCVRVCVYVYLRACVCVCLHASRQTLRKICDIKLMPFYNWVIYPNTHANKVWHKVKRKVEEGRERDELLCFGHPYFWRCTYINCCIVRIDTHPLRIEICS